jgi:deoxyribose-phosphate aldolase
MAAEAPAAAAQTGKRNPGMPLDMGWVMQDHVNLGATMRRVEWLAQKRTVKLTWQAAWLLKAVTCVDLTTLQGDDTPGNVTRLCHKARTPVRQDILDKLGFKIPITVGAVCVYPARVPDAVKALAGSGIPVAAVATGFPSGQYDLETRLAEIRRAVSDGAKEIDIVINRNYALTGQWDKVYIEVQQMREACGEAHLKAILAIGELYTLTTVWRASLVCMMAGADFIKTSTGKERTNAVMEVGIVMARAVREYYQRTGIKIGFKPAGGIRTARQSVDWLIMIKEELGNEWLSPQLFRFGASGVLTDIERQLWHSATGEYASERYMPLS